MVTTRRQARGKPQCMQPASKKPIAKRKPRRFSSISKKFNDLSSGIIYLINQDATDDEIKKELDRNKSRLLFLPSSETGVFYLAAQKQRYNVVDQLLARQDRYEWNSLHLAVLYDEKFILDHFRSKIPELGCLGKQQKLRDTPLHLAFRMGNARICKLLLENGCWERYTGDDRDCLGHMAISEIAYDRKSATEKQSEWVDLINWLYEQGGMSLDTKNPKGLTVEDLIWDLKLPFWVPFVIRTIKFGVKRTSL